MDGEISPAELEGALSSVDAERDGESAALSSVDAALDSEDAVPDNREPLVVDIRQPEAYRRGHIPESLNVPLPDLASDVSRVAGADHVVTVCPHGKASVKAARLIAAYEDFDGRVESLDGGLTAWDGELTRGPDVDTGTGRTDEGPEAPF